MYFVINGNDGSSELTIKGYRCRDHCPVDPNDEQEESEPTFWSEPTTWTNVFDPVRIPEAGDEVRIITGMNVIYDMEESPIFKSIAIDGKLSFASGLNAKIHAQNIWVRRGEMNIGKVDEPYDGTIEFALYGSDDDAPAEFTFDPDVVISNSNFIVTGALNAYAAPRTRFTRLLAPA